jgi:caffeoyl-CoA O-methyltransferase
MELKSKSFSLPPEVHRYIVEHLDPLDAVQRELIEETAKLGRISMMQIAPEQGAFMELLTRLSGAREAIEVGTFTGYSALCIARGLGPDGRLLCLDTSEEWTAIARRFWQKAGVAERIELRLGPAADSLRALPAQPRFDLAFIDADKQSYRTYYEELLPRLRPGGLILCDNVLWFGSVADPSNQEESTRHIRAFNDHVAADPRVDKAMLPLGDGLTILRKR